MMKVSIASAPPTAPAAIALRVIVRSATVLRAGTDPLAISPEAIVPMVTSPAARDRRVATALVRSPSAATSVPTALAAIALKVIVRRVIAHLVIGVRVLKETSVRAPDPSMANSAPSVLAAIALRVIGRLGTARPVAIGPSATVRKANVPSVIGRPASPSAKSRAAANPLAASRVASQAARAVLAASPVALAVRPADRVVVVLAAVAPVGAAPRAEGADAL